MRTGLRAARWCRAGREVRSVDGVGDDRHAAGRDAGAQHGVLLARVRHADHLSAMPLHCQRAICMFYPGEALFCARFAIRGLNVFGLARRCTALNTWPAHLS